MMRTARVLQAHDFPQPYSQLRGGCPMPWKRRRDLLYFRGGCNGPTRGWRGPIWRFYARKRANLLSKARPADLDGGTYPCQKQGGAHQGVGQHAAKLASPAPEEAPGGPRLPQAPASLGQSAACAALAGHTGPVFDLGVYDHCDSPKLNKHEWGWDAQMEKEMARDAPKKKIEPFVNNCNYRRMPRYRSAL